MLCYGLCGLACSVGVKVCVWMILTHVGYRYTLFFDQKDDNVCCVQVVICWQCNSPLMLMSYLFLLWLCTFRHSFRVSVFRFLGDEEKRGQKPKKADNEQCRYGKTKWQKAYWLYTCIICHTLWWAVIMSSSLTLWLSMVERWGMTLIWILPDTALAESYREHW